MTRREFVGLTAALGAAGLKAEASGGAVTPQGEVKLKLGVISDIHIVDADSTEPFKEVLREFDAWGADGVMVCGDLADYGVLPQLEEVGKAWFDVFPDGKGFDGRPVANLMHYGDHDTTGSTYRNAKRCVEMFPDEEAMKLVSLGRMDRAGRKAAWENVFKEEWSPFIHRQVKGYDFILANFTREYKDINPTGDNNPGLAEFMATLSLDPSKPFFFSQHRIYKGTACGDYVWGQDDGTTGAFLAEKFPNAFAFCGHGHKSAVNEASIWQGGFTAIEVPSLRYSTTLGGRENGFCSSDRPATRPSYTMPEMRVGEGADLTRQGLLVSVYENCIVVKRREFKKNVSLGPDWVIPLPIPGNRPFAPENRVQTLPRPQFASGAAIAVTSATKKDRVGDTVEMFELRFPSATAVEPRANDYEVRVEVRKADVVHPVVGRRFYPQNYIYGIRDDLDEVVCRMRRDEVPAGKPVRFTVFPVDAFGRFGRPIRTAFREDWIS